MAKKSPYLMFHRTLRKNSAHQTGRTLATLICILNALVLLFVGLALLTTGSPGIGASLAATSLVWILIHSLTQAFFDIADSHLDRIHREHLADSRARAAANPQ